MRKNSNKKTALLLQYFNEKKFNKAEELAKKIIGQTPNDLLGWKVLDAVLKSTGRVKESLESSQKSVSLQPGSADTHNNLGITLRELGKLKESEICYRKAISIDSHFYQAHNNLGIVLHDQGQYDGSEHHLKTAIEIRPDFAQAYNNLGITLKAKESYAKAEQSYLKALAVDPNFSEAYFNLGVLWYEIGEIDSSLKSFATAKKMNPRPICNLVNLLLVKRHTQSNDRFSANKENVYESVLENRRMIKTREVEPELVSEIRRLNSIGLSETTSIATTDARFGEGYCSPDFNLFENKNVYINKAKTDIERYLEDLFRAEIYIEDSFFNVMKANSGTKPHSHISELDEKLSFVAQKFSLVYYLSVGDQASSDPGDLVLYDPEEIITPVDGLIVIIPASRRHSSIYGGDLDRILVGVNFYVY